MGMTTLDCSRISTLGTGCRSSSFGWVWQLCGAIVRVLCFLVVEAHRLDGYDNIQSFAVLFAQFGGCRSSSFGWVWQLPLVANNIRINRVVEAHRLDGYDNGFAVAHSIETEGCRSSSFGWVWQPFRKQRLNITTRVVEANRLGRYDPKEGTNCLSRHLSSLETLTQKDVIRRTSWLDLQKKEIKTIMIQKKAYIWGKKTINSILQNNT